MRHGFGLGYLSRSLGGGGAAPTWMTLLATAVVILVVFKIAYAQLRRRSL